MKIEQTTTANGHAISLTVTTNTDKRFPDARFHAVVKVDGRAWLMEYVTTALDADTWARRAFVNILKTLGVRTPATEA